MTQVLRWYQKIALTLVDKLIIAFVLFVVSLDVSKGFSEIGVDLITTMLVVFLLYVICVFVANIPGLITPNKGRYASWIMAGFAALIIWLLFPKMLEWTFAVTNFLGLTDFHPSLPLQDILLYTFVFRAALVYLLARRMRS